jgi:hypothetical protein
MHGSREQESGLQPKDRMLKGMQQSSTQRLALGLRKRIVKRLVPCDIKIMSSGSAGGPPGLKARCDPPLPSALVLRLLKLGLDSNVDDPTTPKNEERDYC